MFVHQTKLRVRYAETDQMSYVYYGNYAMYYEVARVEALRSLGYRYKSMEEEGVMMPVIESKSKFIKPARYDDLLTIEVSIPKKPSARIVFEYKIYNEKNILLHEGETTLVFVDIKTGRPCEPTALFKKLMYPFFEKK